MKRYVSLICLFLLFSCSTDDEIIADLPETQLLKSIYLNGNLVSEFEYYSDNRIKAQVNLSNGIITSLALFEYSNDTVYRTVSGFYTSSSKSFLKDSNTIKQFEYGPDDNLVFSYLNYYSNDCGLTRIESYTQYDQLYTITEYDYVDSNCSYDSNRKLVSGAQQYRYTIVKDDKKNYRASLSAWPEFAKKHNVLEYTQWDSNDNLLLGNSYFSTYVYNENDYPIEETRTSLTGNVQVYTFDYH